MPHQTPNPHDAEEQLRPLLRDVFDTREALLAWSTDDGDEALAARIDALSNAEHEALGASLDLLGVPHDVVWAGTR